MLDCFFEYGLVDELVDYECNYNDKHIAHLSEDQIRKLVLSHNAVWI